MTTDYKPTPEECEQLVQRYFGGTRPDLRWIDLSEKEQRGLLAEWEEGELARAAEVDRRMAAATGKEPATPAASDALPKYGTRAWSVKLLEIVGKAAVTNAKEAVKRMLPEIIEKELPAIVAQVLPDKLGNVEGRLTLRLDQVNDRFNDRINDTVLKALKGEKNYVNVLELHIRELQSQLRDLEKEVAELRRR